jgi:hypothetical protein
VFSSSGRVVLATTGGERRAVSRLALGGWGEGEREAQGSTGSEAHRVVGIRNSAHPGASDSLWSGQSINILICAGPPVSPHGV